MEQTADMYSQTRLHKRGSVYYFRAMVPKDLRSYFGKQEIIYSLRTKDKTKAIALVRQASPEWDRKFEAARCAVFPTRPKELTLVDDTIIGAVCDAWRHHALDGDTWARSQGLSDADYAEQAAARTATLDILREALSKGRLELVRPALHQFLDLLGLKIAGDPDALRQLSWAFLEAVSETHQAQMQRDRGEAVLTPGLPGALSQLREASMPAIPAKDIGNATDGPTLLELHQRWEIQVQGRKSKTIQAFKRVMTELTEVTGKTLAKSITRGDVIAYRDHLAIMERLHYKTVGRNISYVSAMFGVAVDAEILTSNPAARIKIARPKVAPRGRLPYGIDDLRAIFTSQIYTEGYRPKGGGGEAAAWLPILGAYTGCRLEELGQLQTQDVKQAHGIWYLEVTDTQDESHSQELKTESSRRKMPIHPELIRAGFLRYVERVQKANAVHLFPALRPDCHHCRTGNWSKWWGRFARGKLGIKDARKVFHSLRHTFRDACREAELGEEVSDALMGHAGDSTGRGYGRSFSLKRLHAAISRISYPGVETPVLSAKRSEGAVVKL